MSCKIEKTTAWKEYSNMEGSLTLDPAYFSSKSFIRDFGDWEKVKVHDRYRTHQDGSPKIYTNYSRTMAFYYNKNNEQKFINHVKFHTLEEGTRETIKNEITDVLLSELNSIFKEEGKSLEAIVNSTITIGEYLDNIIYNLIEEHREEGILNPAVEESLRVSRGDYILEIKKRLANIGISYTEEIDEEEEESSGAIVQTSAIYRNTEDKAQFVIKSLLEFLPLRDEFGNLVFSEVFPNREKIMNKAKAWGVLLPALSDIPMSNTKDNIQIYLKALKKTSIKHPWVATVYNSINKGNLDLQIAFVTAFNNVKNSIYTFINTNGALSMLNTEETGNNKKYILKDWVRYAANELYIKDKLIKSKGKEINELIIKAKSAFTIIKREKKDSNKNRVLKTYRAISPILNILNIYANAETFHIAFYEFVENLDNKSTTTIKEEDKLPLFLLKLHNTFLEGGMFEDISSKDAFKIKATSTLTFLAEAHIKTEELTTAKSATVGDKRLYLYSLPSIIQELVNQFKADPLLAQDVMDKNTHLKNSLFLQAMTKAEVLQSINVGIRGVIQNHNEASKAKNSKLIALGDFIKADMFAILQRKFGKHSPNYSTQIPADKTTEHLINNTGVFKKSKNIKDIVHIFSGYLDDEVQEMLKAKLEIEDAIEASRKKLKIKKGITPEILNLASQSLTLGYTLDKAGNIGTIEKVNGEWEITKYTGNAFKFKLFESLPSSPKLFNTSTGYLVPNSIEEVSMALKMLKEEIDEHIEEELTKRVQEFENWFDSLGFKIEIASWNESIFNKDASDIDNSILEDYRKEYETLGGIVEAKKAIFREYVTNHIISKIEFSKLFTGSLQHFKHIDDYIKRTPFTQLTGLQPIVGITEGDIHFSQMTFKTELFDSELLNSNFLSDSAKEYYENIDRTDAQAWITPKRWLFLLERTSKVSSKQREVYFKLNKQWEDIQKGIKITPLTPGDTKILSMQPLKGVYGKNDYEKHPVYLKYSQAVLIPELVNNNPKAKALLDYMLKNNIDEAIAETGIKLGSNKAVALEDNYVINKEGNLELDLDGKFEPLILDNINWRLQQELPTKGIHLNKIGTQIQKIVLDGLAFMGNEIITDNHYPINGPELVKKINSALGNLSDLGMRSLKNSFGISDKDYIIKDIDKFYKPIIRELEKNGEDIESIVNVMKNGYSLAAIPSFEKKAIASFMSAAKKAAINLLTQGGAFIQTSDHLMGINDLTKNGVKLLIPNFDKLRPPRVIKENGKTIVIPGQVLIPHSLIVKYIPNYRELSIATLNKMLPLEVREMIGYRIPTQSRASADILEVIGILPEGVGDEIIAYGEITAKTGSDFDIDKMFFMLPELSISTKNNKAILEINKKGNAGIRNRVFDLFRKTLKSPLLYEDMMTSIDNDITELSVNSINPDVTSHDLQVFTPIFGVTTRFNLKAGQAGIGEMVNAMNNHIISQGKGIVNELGLGNWGNSIMDLQFSESLTKEELYGTSKYKGVLDYILDKTDKKDRAKLKSRLIKELPKRKISSVLSDLTNAFVDIANKKAFITKGNWGSLLNSYGTMLIRNGVHSSKVFALLQQPIITELVKEISVKEGIISSTSSFTIRKNLLNKYIDKLNGINEFSESYRKKEPDLSELSLLRLLHNANNKEETFEFLQDQILVLQHIISTLGITKIYSNSLRANKLGENGVGKSMGEFFVKKNLISSSYTTSGKYFFKNIDTKFFNQKGEGTLLMKFYENTVHFMDNMIDSNPDLFYGYNNRIKKILNEVLADSSRVKFILSDTIANILLEHSKAYLFSDFEALNGLYTKETKDKLIEQLFKEKLTRKYPILDMLHEDTTPTGNILVMNKVSTLNSHLKEELIKSWERLLRDKPVLGKFLIHMSYGKSIFRPGPRNFSELIPPNYLIKQGINEYVSEVAYLDNNFKEQLARNRGLEEVFNSKLNTIEDKKVNGARVTRVINGNNNIYGSIYSNINVIPKFAENKDGQFLKLLGFRVFEMELDKKITTKAEAIYAEINRVPKNTVYYSSNHDIFMDYLDPKEEEITWSKYVKSYPNDHLISVEDLENNYRKQDLVDINMMARQHATTSIALSKQIKGLLNNSEDTFNQKCAI